MEWSEPFIPFEKGVGPEGVSYLTHEIEYLSAGWQDIEQEPGWFPNVEYRYRARSFKVLSFDELNKKRDSVKAELDAIDEELQRRDLEEREEMQEAYEFLADIYEAGNFRASAGNVRRGALNHYDISAARLIREKLEEVRNND